LLHRGGLLYPIKVILTDIGKSLELRGDILQYRVIIENGNLLKTCGQILEHLLLIPSWLFVDAIPASTFAMAA